MDAHATTLANHRVLVLGGMGFIGSNLAAACLAQGAAVTVFDSLAPQSGANRANLAALDGRVRTMAADIRDAEALAAVLPEQTIVFNCAALTSHPGSMRDPFENLDVNGRGVLTVLDVARRVNPAVKIVQVGTSTQIGKMHAEPIDEWHAEFPVDVYSAHKSLGEKYTLIYARAHGLRATVVRLANTFGPRASIRSPEFGFMNYFIGLALQGKPITVYGDGQQQRNICFVDDSVAALICAALVDEANGDMFFATADQQVTVRHVAESIADVIGGSVQFIEWPADRAAIEVGDAVISNARIHTRLGWRPTYTLADGLARTRDYFAPRLSEYL